MPAMSSVGGQLSLLKDDNPKLQAKALRSLLASSDDSWNEISDYLQDIEELYESPDFPERKQAALLLSKVYYHLGEYRDAFMFSLGAGDMFDVKKGDQYTLTIIRKCIDRYCELRSGKKDEVDKSGGHAHDGKAKRDGAAETDKEYQQLHALFSSLMSAWVAEDQGKWTQITEHIGLCLAAHRIDLLESIAAAYIKATNSAEILTCIMHYANKYVTNVDFREDVLRTVIKLYSEGPEKLRSLNLFDMQQCLLFLNDPRSVSKNLTMLLDSSSTQSDLIAYQLAFDLFDHCNQDFLHAVNHQMKAHLDSKSSKESDGDKDKEKDKATEIPENYKKLFTIMTGALTIGLQFQFLYSQNNSGLETMKKLKSAIDSQTKSNAITHNAGVMANAIMFCGTTCDQFLRENLEWLSKASNWARFTATASLGVINKGHVSQSMQVLQSYLPSAPGASGASPYQEGGALYGLGLIHAPVGCNLKEDVQELIAPGETDQQTRPREVLNFLIQCVQANEKSEQLIHGACLGIGLASIASKDEAIYELLKQVMDNDNAVSGEAATVAIGLLYLGSGDERAVEELLGHGKDTQHEKMIRGVSMALSMLMYGKEGHADVLIEDMLGDNDPWLRLGGVQVIGMAYAGTSNRKAIERLLTVAVQDTSDDVRRAAVLNIGFVTFKEPQLCINVTALFADSHSPHIRWGVASALGIAAAGTGNKHALAKLTQLKKDSSDFVRQGAIVSMAMVLMQKTPEEIPLVKEFKEEIMKRIEDKYEEILSKFGCILACGILDAGGKNQTICLQKNGHNLVKPIVGLHMFMQYWYWYPYVLMFSMALQPTCMIALNKELKMPKYVIRSDAPPSLFGVPKRKEGGEEKGTKKREKVVLSTTTKEQKRKNKKKEAEGLQTPLDDKMDEDKEEDKKETKKEEEEEKQEILHNPARVTLGQLEVLSVTEDARYTPVKPGISMGVIMVRDGKPDEAEDLVPIVNPGDVNADPDEKDEPGPPEPFTWP